jgi:polyhydroxyalkanoate synthesis regulator phasin
MADEFTLEMDEIQNQPKKDLTELNKRVEQNLNNVETKLTAAKSEVTKFKARVYDVIAEMD